MAGQGKSWGKHCRNSRGAVAVEFALVLPLLGMLLFGIITFGLAFSDKIALVNAVREGGRFGASTDNVSSWGTSVVDQTVSLYANADSPLTSDQVCALLVKRSGSPSAPLQSSDDDCDTGSTNAGPVPTPPSAASMPAGSCYVLVWAAMPEKVNWLLHTTTVTLTAQSVSYYGRVSGTTCTYSP